MYDYHTHTSYSDDCNTPIRDMVDAACNSGYTEMAVTDHYDPDYPDLEFPFELKFSDYHKTLEEFKVAYKDKIKIVKGIEIGIQHGETMKKCSAVARNYDYDFIIGSFHCAEGLDLYGKSFFKNRSIEDSYIAFYTYMYECLKVYRDYDVIGHFNIIDRYSDSVPNPMIYKDIIEEILKMIIDNGKGLEINTSSFRYGMGTRTTPAQGILQLYKDLGGEIVTTGSDAHQAEFVGYRIKDAQELIKSVGLRYVTTFDQRKPNFVKL